MINIRNQVVFLTFVLAVVVEAWPWDKWFPLDPSVGDVTQVSADDLTDRLRGKTALVVGGTDGIGRGCAIAMAQAGASVVIVGHSPTKAHAVLGNMSAIAQFPQEQKFKAYSVDLLTVKGGLGLTAQLNGNKTRFDYVILTVGMWPNSKEPLSGDGLDKVISLDVVARYLVFREIVPLLNPGARVMSVLASGWRRIFWRDAKSITADRMKEIAAGKVEGHYSLPEMLGTAATLSDTWLQLMSDKHYPEIGFVGTFPGVVATDVAAHGTFPKWLDPFIEKSMKAVGLDPVFCGRLHAMIVSSPNAARRPATFFTVNQVSPTSVTLEGRVTNDLVYDPDFGSWAQSFLEGTIANHTATADLLIV